MYKVYETCKANETPSGRFVRVDRVVTLNQKIDRTISIPVVHSFSGDLEGREGAEG